MPSQIQLVIRVLLSLSSSELRLFLADEWGAHLLLQLLLLSSYGQYCRVLWPKDICPSLLEDSVQILLSSLRERVQFPLNCFYLFFFFMYYNSCNKLISLSSVLVIWHEGSEPFRWDHEINWSEPVPSKGHHILQCPCALVSAWPLNCLRSASG